MWAEAEEQRGGEAQTFGHLWHQTRMWHFDYIVAHFWLFFSGFATLQHRADGDITALARGG